MSTAKANNSSQLTYFAYIANQILNKIKKKGKRKNGQAGKIVLLCKKIISYNPMAHVLSVPALHHAASEPPALLD